MHIKCHNNFYLLLFQLLSKSLTIRKPVSGMKIGPFPFKKEIRNNFKFKELAYN